MRYELILASASPRRRELLNYLGIPFSVCAADVDEDAVEDKVLSENVVRRAELKAQALADTISENAILITADTIVVLQDVMLNKPRDARHAKSMLTQLRHAKHQVYTGMVILSGRTQSMMRRLSMVDVYMRDYSDTEISRYIETGDPMDKAGAYAIQHSDFRPVTLIEGCYTAVMGLSLCQVANTLMQLGVHIAADLQIDTEKHQYQTCALCRKLWHHNSE